MAVAGHCEFTSRGGAGRRIRYKLRPSPSVAGEMRVASEKSLNGTVLRYREQAWRFLAMVLLAAFTLQSYVTQTHIHGASQTFSSTGAVKVLSKSSAQSGTPGDTSETGCPFCQAIVHSGAFFAPSAPVLVLPSEWFERATLAALTSVYRAAWAHNWQSRAPPRL